MKPQQQAEFDFDAGRQIRIGHALRASPGVTRAVPLSDLDKLILACMSSFAQHVAVEVDALTDDLARVHIAKRIDGLVAQLNDTSPEFASETARYLLGLVGEIRRIGADDVQTARNRPGTR